MTRLRAAVAFGAWSALSAFGSPVHAEPKTSVQLAYELAPGTEGCPDVETFQSTVKRQLGYDPFLAGADRRVAVKIARTETGFDGSIKWTDADGKWAGDRHLSSQRSDCSEIAANVAFAVAVQLQLLAALSPETPAPSASGTGTGTGTAKTAAAATVAPKPAPVPPNDGSKASTSPERSASGGARFRLAAGLGPSLALGLAPKVTGLGRLFVTGRLDPFSLELAVEAALPVSQTQPDGSGFTLNRLAFGAAACGHVQPFAACLTAMVGRLEARGFGVDNPSTPSGVFSQLGARVAVTHDLSERFFVGARLEGLVMLAPWTVTLDDTVAWTTPRVGGLFGLDFGVYFF